MESVPTYKPSVFYFRKSLRESSSASRAIVIAKVVCHEWEQLRCWTAEQNLTALPDPDAKVEFFRALLAGDASHGQAVLLGMFLCYELEQLKANVREAGLIPPKWIVDDREAEEKGWTAANDEAVNL